MKSDHPSSQSGGGGGATSSTPKLRRKWLYRTLWALLVLIASPCIYWYWCRHVALAERDALVAEIHARGEPVWWHEVVEKAEREQPEDNGAELFVKAIDVIGGVNASKKILFGGDLAEAFGDQFPEPKVVPEAQQQLHLATSAISLSNQAVQRKPGLISILRNYDPNRTSLPHVTGSRGIHRMLRWEAFDALALNDPRRAFRAMELGLRCAEQLSAEPLILTQFVRLSNRSVTCHALWNCLAYSCPNEVEFRVIDGLLAAHDDGFGIDAALVGERAIQLGMLEDDIALRNLTTNWAMTEARHLRGSEAWMRDAWVEVLSTPLATPIRLRTETELLRMVESSREFNDRPNVDPESEQRLVKEFERRSPLHQSLESPRSFHMGWLSGSQRMWVQAHQRLIFTRLALRLRRHYDKHGRFPEKLDELCDAAMPKIRIDWFQNHPIVYKPTAKGFHLEVPEASVPSWEREHLKQTPLRTEYGLEFELRSK